MDRPIEAVNIRIIVDGITFCILFGSNWCVSLTLIVVSASSAILSGSPHLFEIRKHAFPIPARIAQLLPCVIIIRTPTVPYHGVQDATAPKNLALRQRSSSTIELCLWSCGEPPIIATANVSTNIHGKLDHWLIVVSALVSL